MTDIDPAAIMAAHASHVSSQMRNGCIITMQRGDREPCEPYRLAEALAGARKDVEEYAPILDRCSQLLTGVANALKGSPPPLTSWSHHDLPEKAQATVDALAASEAKVSRVEAEVVQWEIGGGLNNAWHRVAPALMGIPYAVGRVRAALADQPKHAS